MRQGPEGCYLFTLENGIIMFFSERNNQSGDSIVTCSSEEKLYGQKTQRLLK